MVSDSNTPFGGQALVFRNLSLYSFQSSYQDAAVPDGANAQEIVHTDKTICHFRLHTPLKHCGIRR